MWEAAGNFLRTGYDYASNLFGDDLIDKGVEAGVGYLLGDDDDQSSASTKLKRLRGRVGIRTAAMAAPGATKAPASRVTSTYDVVYNRYNSIFRNAIASAKSTTVRRRG